MPLATFIAVPLLAVPVLSVLAGTPPLPSDGIEPLPVHGDEACPKALYRATIGGGEHVFELSDCGEWTLEVVATAGPAADAGLKPGHIVYAGGMNDEIGAPEGSLTIPGPCGTIDVQTSPTLTRPWTALDFGDAITFELPAAEGCAAPAWYGSTLRLVRMPEVARDGEIAAPAIGCAAYVITGDGNRGFADRPVELCLTEGGVLTGKAGGERVLAGALFGLDGSIEAAYASAPAAGCAPYPFRVVGAQGRDGTFRLEGYEPILTEDCRVEAYNDIRLHFERADLVETSE